MGFSTLFGSHRIIHQNYREPSRSSNFLSSSLLVLSLFSSFARLKAASQEAEAVRREQTVWERKVGELQSRCSTLEEEKYEALAKVRESVQVAEEAALQKDQVTLSSFISVSPPPVFFFSLVESSPQSIELYYPPDKCPFIPLPTEMCVCPNPLPSGPVKRETEGRRAGEDKGGHQTVNPGCCSPHKKRGEWLTEQELFLLQFLQKLVQH